MTFHGKIVGASFKLIIKLQKKIEKGKARDYCRLKAKNEQTAGRQPAPFDAPLTPFLGIYGNYLGTKSNTTTANCFTIKI